MSSDENDHSDENPEAEYVPPETNTDELFNEATDDSSEENGRDIEIPSDEFLGKIPEEPRTGTAIQIKTTTYTKKANEFMMIRNNFAYFTSNYTVKLLNRMLNLL